jgi:hypothetical protein
MKNVTNPATTTSGLVVRDVTVAGLYGCAFYGKPRR